MPFAHRFIAPLALVAVLAACTGDGAQLAGSDCGSPQARLAQIGINPADIDGVEFQVERGQEGTVLQRYAWVRLKSCDGYVVVRTTAGCSRSGSQPYATGNCRIPEGSRA